MADKKARREPKASEDGNTAGQLVANTPAAGTSPGLTAVMEAVKFTNSQVLDQTGAADLDMGAKTMAEQAAAMMIQDMRAFLQSTEMVLVPATAKAIAEILAGNENGAPALVAIETLMEKLPVFATGIAQAAGAVTKDFE